MEVIAEDLRDQLAIFLAIRNWIRRNAYTSEQ